MVLTVNQQSLLSRDDKVLMVSGLRMATAERQQNPQSVTWYSTFLVTLNLPSLLKAADAVSKFEKRKYFTLKKSHIYFLAIEYKFAKGYVWVSGNG